jgi:hypothetical protein
MDEHDHGALGIPALLTATASVNWKSVNILS